ncbi:MAG: TadE/TadG family type IV pilus assembly protein [Acidimicrobiales bacterium]
MSTRPTSTAPGRWQGDQGVALVEAALITPVLLVLLLGMLDTAYLYRDYLTSGEAVADGAKVGAIQGNKTTSTGATADYTIIAAMRQDTATLRPADIDRIVIFKANASTYGSPLAQVPAQCKTSAGPVTNTCNVYVPLVAFYQVQTGNADYFKCLAGGQPACGWNPLLTTAPSGRPDGPTPYDIAYLGVYMKLKHKNLTGLLGASKDIEVASIARLEPGNIDPT